MEENGALLELFAIRSVRPVHRGKARIEQELAELRTTHQFKIAELVFLGHLFKDSELMDHEQVKRLLHFVRINKAGYRPAKVEGIVAGSDVNRAVRCGASAGSDTSRFAV